MNPLPFYLTDKIIPFSHEETNLESWDDYSRNSLYMSYTRLLPKVTTILRKPEGTLKDFIKEYWDEDAPYILSEDIDNLSFDTKDVKLILYWTTRESIDIKAFEWMQKLREKKPEVEIHQLIIKLMKEDDPVDLTDWTGQEYTYLPEEIKVNIFTFTIFYDEKLGATIRNTDRNNKALDEWGKMTEEINKE